MHRGIDGSGGVRRRLAICGALVLGLTGCAVADDTAGQASPVPRAELAGKAEIAARNLAQQSAGSAGKSDKPGERKSADAPPSGGADGADRIGQGAGGSDNTSDAGSSEPGTDQAASTSWRRLQVVPDAKGDHGNGPGYADLSSLALEDDGTRLRATFAVDGTVPGSLADGEVEGIGLDVYRSSSTESDFQVFLDGGSHGWRAFLQTPQGFVDFPGSLSVVGDRLVAVVPWSAVGGRRDAEVSAFADWSDGSGGSSTDSVDRSELRLG